MSWEYAPEFDAAHRAALKSGKSLIYQCHPAWWATLPLFRQFDNDSDPGLQTVVLVPEAFNITEGAALLQSIDECRPAHATTGLTRTRRLLKSGDVKTLVSTPADAIRLLTKAGLNLQDIGRVIIGWPELYPDQTAFETLDTILGECKGAQRIVVTSSPKQLEDFLERHARRAPTLVASTPPEESIGSVRYAVSSFLRVPGDARSALDIMDPESCIIWDPLEQGIRTDLLLTESSTVRIESDPSEEPVKLAIALELPTPEVYQALNAIASTVLLLVRSFQIPFIKHLASSSRVLRLPDESDRALNKAEKLRRRLRERIDDGDIGDGLLALSPLFDEYDAATVAAAALADGSVFREAEPSEDSSVPTWVRIRMDAGRKDRIRTGDLVGALLNAVEVPKKQIGRVEVRDSYSLVEVRAEMADKAIKGLNGLTLRGNKLAARIDRH